MSIDRVRVFLVELVRREDGGVAPEFPVVLALVTAVTAVGAALLAHTISGAVARAAAFIPVH